MIYRLTPLVITIFVLVTLLSSCNNGNKKQKRNSLSELKIEQYLQAPKEKYKPADLKGKAIVLEFWATWCAPCVSMMPHLNSLSRKFEKENIVFISVTNESSEKVEHFLKRNQINGWIGLDTNNSVFRAFEIGYIPQTVLIFPNGKLAAKTKASEVTEDMLNDLLEGSEILLNKKETIRKSTNSKVKEEESKPSFYRINIDTTSRKYGLQRVGKTVLISEAITVKDYLAKAFEVEPYQVLGHDSLLNLGLEVDISTPGMSEDKFREVLINSLKNALFLDIDKSRRNFQAFILTSPNKAVNGLREEKLNVSHASSSKGVFAASSSSIRTLINQVYETTDKIVIDETNLNQRYSWALTYDTLNVLSVFDSLESNLGLKVEKKKRKLDALIVTD